MIREEAQRLERDKEEIEALIEALFQNQRENLENLGKEYYAFVKENPDQLAESVLPCVEKIDQTEAEIAVQRERIQGIEAALQEPMVIICPKCGKEMEGEARYCSGCGTYLWEENQPKEEQERLCANCGNPLKKDARFCGKCGTPAV